MARALEKNGQMARQADHRHIAAFPLACRQSRLLWGQPKHQDQLMPRVDNVDPGRENALGCFAWGVPI